MARSIVKELVQNNSMWEGNIASSSIWYRTGSALPFSRLTTSVSAPTGKLNFSPQARDLTWTWWAELTREVGKGLSKVSGAQSQPHWGSKRLEARP